LRAVIFDLWNTLAKWPEEAWAEVRPRVAKRLGMPLEEFEQRWYDSELHHLREMGPLATVLARFDVSPDVAEEIAELRRPVTMQGLTPVDGAVETISELRRRGFRIGLITVCTDDVPALWSETPFHGLFDAEVFSCSVGLRKPDPRIYLLCCEQLGVDPGDAVFVGDGANDELAGADRVGMTSVLLEGSPEEPEDWDGRRIRALPELLELGAVSRSPRTG
jgi:putative hydrolase of the HAD superfamily